MEVPRDIQLEITVNQNQLKNAIRSHQILVWKLKDDPNNEDIKLGIQEIHKEIVDIGHIQRNIVERLRKTVQSLDQKLTQKPGLEERRFNLANVLNKTRKQAIVSRSTSLSPLSPPSDESQDIPVSEPKTPESLEYPDPASLDSPTQSEFLGFFGLCTHEVFKELQNKRVERKRRSTANPHFLYGNHWENNKIKRRKNVYLQSNFSPPNTRSALRKQKEERRIPSPPIKSESRSTSPVPISSNNNKNKSISAAIGLNIPNLPSGLTIERVENNSSSPDLKTCIICRLPGGLSLCEKCESHFHISCHNRPLTNTPRHCPKCAPKRDRDLTSYREPVSMTVVLGNGVQVSREFKERLEEKKRLQEQNINLNNQINNLKARHAELTISLKTQEEEKKELLICEHSAKENIQRILDFVKNIKGTTATTCEISNGS